MKEINHIITELRQKIDFADAELFDLLIKRFDLSDELISQKLQAGIDTFDPEREYEIVSILKQDFGHKLNDGFIAKFSKLLLTEAKKRKDVNSHSILKDKMIIAGPCVVESEEQIGRIASFLSKIGIKYLRGGAFKPRTSPNTFMGLGDEGIDLLHKAAVQNGMLTVSEFLDHTKLEQNYDKIDIVQIGSRNMSSSGLLKQVGKITAMDNKPVILKRGFSSTLTEFLFAADYLRNEGNENVILCLRGIRTFEQIDSNMRNTPDLGAIIELKETTGLKIIFDPSHSTGNSRFVADTARAAIALGADGLLVETHFDPQNALIDGKQTITLEQMNDLLASLDLCI